MLVKQGKSCNFDFVEMFFQSFKCFEKFTIVLIFLHLLILLCLLIFSDPMWICCMTRIQQKLSNSLPVCVNGLFSTFFGYSFTHNVMCEHVWVSSLPACGGCGVDPLRKGLYSSNPVIAYFFCRFSFSAIFFLYIPQGFLSWVPKDYQTHPFQKHSALSTWGAYMFLFV